VIREYIATICPADGRSHAATVRALSTLFTLHQLFRDTPCSTACCQLGNGCVSFDKSVLRVPVMVCKRMRGSSALRKTWVLRPLLANPRLLPFRRGLVEGSRLILLKSIPRILSNAADLAGRDSNGMTSDPLSDMPNSTPVGRTRNAPAVGRPRPRAGTATKAAYEQLPAPRRSLSRSGRSRLFMALS